MVAKTGEEGGLGGLFWAINTNHTYIIYDLYIYNFFCFFWVEGEDMKIELDFISTG